MHTFGSPRFICFIDDQASADGGCKLVELLSALGRDGGQNHIGQRNAIPFRSPAKRVGVETRLARIAPESFSIADEFEFCLRPVAPPGKNDTKTKSHGGSLS